MRIPRAMSERESLLRRLVIGAGVIVVVGCGIGTALKLHGDIKLHYETGRRFLAGEFLYTGGHDFPYPPLLGLIYAPAALLPLAVAKWFLFAFGVAALLALLVILQRITRSTFSLNHTQAFWVSVTAVFLSIQFIIHDQAVLGLNTTLVLLSWLGIYCWRQGRDLPGAASLGLAVAIKCTAAIFVGYFLWKRQWRFAFYAIVASLFFTVLPAVWQGPALWTAHMQTWIGTAVDGVRGSGFSEGSEFRDKSMSLRPSLMRYLVEQKAFERFGDPPPLHLLNLPPVVARWIVNGIAFALVAVFLWWGRGPVKSRDDPRHFWELAATGILMLLLSPITWGQHCVALLPACYLIAALLVVRDRLPIWMIALLSLYVVFCVLAGRDLVGRDIGLILVAYKVATFCIVGLFPILLAGPRLAPPFSTNG
jgi:alpha-1,2-mannosyltransferase